MSELNGELTPDIVKDFNADTDNTLTELHNDVESPDNEQKGANKLTNAPKWKVRPSHVAAAMMHIEAIGEEPSLSTHNIQAESIEMTNIDYNNSYTSQTSRKGLKSNRKVSPKLNSYSPTAYSHLRESDFSEDVYGRVQEDDDLDALPLPAASDSHSTEATASDGRLLFLPGSAEAQDAEERSKFVETTVQSWGRFLKGWGVLKEDGDDDDDEEEELGEHDFDNLFEDEIEEGEDEEGDVERKRNLHDINLESKTRTEATRRFREKIRQHHRKDYDEDDEDNDRGMEDRDVDNNLDTFRHTLSLEERAHNQNFPRSLEPSVDVAAENSRSTFWTPRSAFMSRLWLRARQFFAFFGMSMLVAVGYMDPGNWETNLDAGSTFKFRLLWAVVASSVIGFLFQYLAVKLGVATDRDLARMCRAVFSRKTNILLWITAEIGIVATDIASIIGSAIAMRMLTKLPLYIGFLITTLDVLLILLLQGKRQRIMELIVGSFAFIIFICFCVQLSFVNENAGEVFSGFFPAYDTFSHSRELILMIGILGATVMPHNLYLHSAIIQSRKYPRTPSGRKLAINLSSVDSVLSLTAACFVNVAIVVLSASAFYSKGGKARTPTLEEAQKILQTAVGQRAAGFLFAFALLLSGQASTVTSTLTGQFIMEGFLDLKFKPWARRLVTRLAAILPAFFILVIFGESALDELIIVTQVLLSFQLPFAILPLVWMTSNDELMGFLVNSKTMKYVAYATATLVVSLNAYLLFRVIFT